MRATATPGVPPRVSAPFPRSSSASPAGRRLAGPATAFALGREAATLIPGAALIPLPGTSHLYYHGEWPAVLDGLLGFLGEPGGAAGPSLTSREIEGSSAG
ncbi:MAG TPA: hypothetical protein VIF35_05230 [Streptosporangiaceae bacterium]|jgi:hypothetical protein